MTPAAPPALVRACRRVGAEIPRWTQGTGGNLSVKAGTALWIKASGVRLDAVGARGGPEGLARLDREGFLGAAEAVAGASDREQAYAAALARWTVPGEGLGRPSMEAGFHALLDAAWVLHFHSIASVIMAELAVREPRAFEALWAGLTSLGCAVVPPVPPGAELMPAVGALRGRDVLLLRNHGVLLQGDDPDRLLDAWSDVERAFLSARGVEGVLARLRAPVAELVGAVSSGPLRLYFPDAAVFLDRVRGVLEPAGERDGEPCFRLVARALEADRDATEIWLATRLLHEAMPDLAELPAEIAGTVGSLPLERLRRAARSDR